MIAFIVGLIVGIFLGAFIAIYTVGHITVRFPIPMDISKIIEQMEHNEHDPDSQLYDDEIEDDSDYEDDFEEENSEDSNDNLD